MENKATLIVRNAKVFTADAANPRAEAVAVRGKRIVYVGNDEGAEAWRGPDTRVVDGQGHTLMPGFIDSHFHLLSGSLGLGDAQLYEANSVEKVGEVVWAFIAENPDQEWIVGRGQPYTGLPNETLTRQQLDAMSPDRPLVVMAYDAHTAWANTAALEAAGILNGGEPRGPNSEIVMAPDGTASGELREPGAFSMVFERAPKLDEAGKRRMLQKGLAQCASLGLTSVHNMDGRDDLLAFYAALEDLGEATLRAIVPYDVTPQSRVEDLQEAVRQREAYQGEMARGGMVKFFMDGVVETWTALLLSDYHGMPGKRGGALFEAEQFNELAVAADKLGLQIAVHAVGDGAVRRALDGFAEARRVNGARDSRHRIEHIELLHPDDAGRFAELGVTASMQPLHAPLNTREDVWTERVDPARWNDSFAWRTAREAGARLVFGSDWPIVTQDPFKGLQCALTREPYGEDGLDQRQTLEEALLSHTRDAAWAEHQEGEKGQLRAGMLADLTLASADLFALPPDELGEARSLLTVCDGRVVFEG